VSALPTASRASVDRATATVPPVPPADTPTPTITPTPFVHVVQQGDTLQAIAFEYGVSVEALQRVNGIENPQFLQLDQRLIIPLNEEGDDAQPGLLLPSPTPQPVQIRGVALYETPVGSLWALGEVANTTAITLTNVQVKVMLFDQDGQPVAETDAFAEVDLLPPQASSPFGILFTTPPDWASYQVTIIRGQEAGALADAYVSMALTDVDGRPLGSQFEVSGTVTNVSTGQVAKSIDIIVTTYDAQGAVTGFRQHTVRLDKVLAPGAEMPFSLSLAAHGGTPDDFSIIALGRVADA
jgi:LysM repeat protein